MTLRSARVAAPALALVAALAAFPAPADADLAPPPAPLIEGPSSTTWPQPPEVAAPVFLLVDAPTGQVLASRGADERRPVASTIKILTALTAAERAELDDAVEIGPEVQGLEGASVGLTPGERWTVEQLLQGMLVRSGNDAAEAVAALVAGDRESFVELMIEDARAVGVRVGGPSGAVITSVTGLDDGQRLSARDLATLSRVLLADDELRAIVAADEVTLPGVGTDENRNLLVGSYAGATGIKTGFTEAAGNSVVASAERGGRELIAVVLGAGPDPARFEDATALLDHGFEAFAAETIEADVTLLVAGGERRLWVEPTAVTTPVGSDLDLDVPLPLWPPESDELAAPLRLDGVPVATATVAVDGTRPAPLEGGARLGRAAADGIYAALRADHERDRLR